MRKTLRQTDQAHITPADSQVSCERIAARSDAPAYPVPQMIRQLAARLIALCLLTVTSVNAFASLDVPLDGIDGEQYKVSGYIGQGKWVVLNIWGTRCPPCREEMPELVSFHDEHKDTDAVVLGIAIDFPSYGYADKAEVSQFADDYLIDFPLLLSDASITKKLGLGYLEGLPSTFIFDPKGKVVGMQVGAITQKILEDYIKKLMLQSPGSSKH